jgi:hypothetical protein
MPRSAAGPPLRPAAPPRPQRWTGGVLHAWAWLGRPGAWGAPARVTVDGGLLRLRFRGGPWPWSARRTVAVPLDAVALAGDDQLELQVEAERWRISGPWLRPLARCLAAGAERLSLPAHKYGVLPSAMILSPERLELVAGPLGRRLGVEAVVPFEGIDAVELLGDRLRAFGGGALRLAARVRPERRLPLALSALLARQAAAADTGLDVRGFVVPEQVSERLARVQLRLPDEASARVLPAALRREDRRVERGMLVIGPALLIWAPRGAEPEQLDLQTLRLGGPEEDPQDLVFYRGGERLCFTLPTPAAVATLAPSLAATLADLQRGSGGDASGLLAHGQRAVLVGELGDLPVPMADLSAEPDGLRLKLGPDQGWRPEVGALVRIAVTTAKEDRRQRCVVLGVDEHPGGGATLRLRFDGLPEVGLRDPKGAHRIRVMEPGALYRLSEPAAGGERKALARAKAELVDISATGMCVRTRAPLELGQEVRMVAVVAGERLTLDGEVVRVTETPEGREAGVRHFDQSGAHQAVMARVVNSLELQRRAAERASEAS